MPTVEVSCPNCGASDGVPAPHETRICKYCGTHYLLRRPETPSHDGHEDTPGYAAEQGRQVSAMAIAILVMVVLGALFAIIVMTRVKDKDPSTEAPPSYYAPHR